MMPTSDFRPGFRLSTLDVAVLLISGIASAYVMTVEPWLGFAVAFVVLHFFLFCNVLRMARVLELIWAGVFAALVITGSTSLTSWTLVFALCSALTLVLMAIQIRRPSYHGVGWRRLNPQLIDWWRSTVAPGQITG